MEIFLIISQNFTLGEQILQLTIGFRLGNLGSSLISLYYYCSAF